ncbi:MAG: hypothetical protein QNK92_04490 [Amylibacter sp.]
MDHFSIVRDLYRTIDISLICNGIGVLGFMIYMTSYTLVTFQRIDSRGLLVFLSEYDGGDICIGQSGSEL